jgi:hypothetical protein
VPCQFRKIPQIHQRPQRCIASGGDRAFRQRDDLFPQIPLRSFKRADVLSAFFRSLLFTRCLSGGGLVRGGFAPLFREFFRRGP